MYWLFFSFRGPGLASGGGDVLRRRRRRPGGPAAPLGAPGLGGLPEQPGQPGAPDRQRLRGSAGEDYIRTARAKGLPEWAVVWKHGFRTALLPVVTTILNHIPHIIGGSLVVERIFGWPGMGSLLFTSVSSRDYTVIMGLTVVIALTVLATGILMDLVYRLVDPGVGWEVRDDEATAFLLAGLWSDRRAAAAAVFLLAEILLVLLLPLFLGQDPNVTDRTAGFWAPPSPAHLLGTDEAGRDLLSRLLAGGRVSLLVGFASAALGGCWGSPWAAGRL
ncbi:MAG: ABC transporter permease subunit [Evtepia gabavorous]